MKFTATVVVSMILAALGLLGIAEIMSNERNKVNQKIEACVESGGIPVVGSRGHLPYLDKCNYPED